MNSIVFGAANSTPSTAAASYYYLGNPTGTSASATETSRQIIVPASVTLQQLYVAVTTAPGVGKSWAFTIYKNGSPTSLTATISGTNTSATNNLNQLSLVQGDVVSMEVLPSGTPTAAGNIYWNMMTDAAGQIILGGQTSSLNSTTTLFWPIFGNGASIAPTVDTNASVIAASAGTLTKLDVVLAAAPGAGKSYAFTLMVNGVASALTTTISDTNLTNQDTTHSVNIAAGDTLSIRDVPTGTPTSTNFSMGMVFTPTTNGESFFGFESNAPSTAGTAQYEAPNAVGGGLWNATEDNRSYIIGPYLVKKLYMSVNTAPSAGKSWTFTIRKAVAATGLTLSIADANTANNIASNVTYAQGDKLSIEAVGVGTPTGAVRTHGGWLLFIDPSVTTTSTSSSTSTSTSSTSSSTSSTSSSTSQSTSTSSTSSSTSTSKSTSTSVSSTSSSTSTSTSISTSTSSTSTSTTVSLTTSTSSTSSSTSLSSTSSSTSTTQSTSTSVSSTSSSTSQSTSSSTSNSTSQSTTTSNSSSTSSTSTSSTSASTSTTILDRATTTADVQQYIPRTYIQAPIPRGIIWPRR